MRYLDPAIDAVVGLFQRCYERTLGGAFESTTWRLVALPLVGAVSDQDAWTMAALGYARDVWNRLEQDLEQERAKRHQARQAMRSQPSDEVEAHG